MFENVADHATPPRDEPAEMRPPTPGQVAQLAEFVAREPALHLYLTLAATTGARRGQLLALRWIDVDLVGGVSAFGAPWWKVPTVHSWHQRRRFVRIESHSTQRASISSEGSTGRRQLMGE